MKIEIGNFICCRNPRIRDNRPMPKGSEVVHVGKRIKVKAQHGNMMVDVEGVYSVHKGRKTADDLCEVATQRWKEHQDKIDAIKKTQNFVVDQILRG